MPASSHATALSPLTPVLQHPPQLLLRAQDVRVVFFDVDGVLTDGGLYFSEHGETLKRFHTLDGQGIKGIGAVHFMNAVAQSAKDVRQLGVHPIFGPCGTGSSGGRK